MQYPWQRGEVGCGGWLCDGRGRVGPRHGSEDHPERGAEVGSGSGRQRGCCELWQGVCVTVRPWMLSVPAVSRTGGFCLSPIFDYFRWCK